MKISNTFKTFALATAASLAVSAPALGIPAGDEYIPSVPGGNGGQPTGAGGWPGPIPSSISGKASKKKGEPKDSADSPALADSADSAAADQDDSSGVLDTLFNPVVLLLAAGVITIAVAMSLIRKEDSDDPTSRARRSSSDAPPTPDGQIVAGEPRV